MIQVLQGDWVEQLRTLPEQCVHCCVTSPPYWGLWDYGVLGQLGLEKTPEEYVDKLVAGFREVRRVLRDDGTLWLNLGDSYATDTKWGGSSSNKNEAEIGDAKRTQKWQSGLKPKDLVGIPWRVAFALQADGWYLRSDIIWHKPNSMPESVTDRPTKAHEYIFLLSKQMRYFYDAEAIKEPVTGGAHPRANGQNSRMVLERAAGREDSKPNPSRAHLPGNVRHAKGAQAYFDGDFRQRTKAGLLDYAKKVRVAGVTPKSAEPGNGIKANESFHAACVDLVDNRNKRSVWTVATAPYKEAHFATFPPSLIKPCILAGTSTGGCCPKCGAPRERIIEKGAPNLAHQRACGGDRNGEYHGQATKEFGFAKAQDASATKARILAGMVKKKTVGWKLTCDCGETQTVPCTVLDPFAGSGTTGKVALELGRNAILIELSPEYCRLLRERVNITPALPLA